MGSSTARPAISGGHPRICVDIDNVIGETDPVMRAIIARETNGHVDLKYDDIKRFNYWECESQSGRSITRAQWSVIHEIFSGRDSILSVKPVAGVQQPLERLAKRYRLHFATARRPQARRATIDWLELNQFPVHDLHFISHGEKHISLGLFDAAVEDDLDQAVAFHNAGFGLRAYPRTSAARSVMIAN